LALQFGARSGEGLAAVVCPRNHRRAVVTTNAELRRAIKDMAESLAEGVVKLISSMSLKELAALTGTSPSAARSIVEARSSKARPKSGAKASARQSSKSERKPSRAAKSVTKERKLNRRKGAEIEKLRKGVLEALKGADEWLSAKQIGAKIGRGVGSEELSFPINYLRDRGLVSKQGDRSKAQYKITDAGRAHDGNFTIKPSDPADAG
jgi:hypothetical protein